MMKRKVILTTLSALAFLWPIIEMNEPYYPADYEPTKSKLTIDGVLRINAEPTDQNLVDTVINMIVSKGGEAITGGISVYAKAVVLNLLKECGLDLRDATTKTLEQIQGQLNTIETKINAIAKRQEQIHSEDILNNVLGMFITARARYMDYVSGNIAWLAELENKGELSEEELEELRIQAFHDGIDKILFDGAPLATHVTTLASWVLQPNPSDPRKSIFNYYDSTMGEYDKWEYQYYRNIKNFIAYLDGTLIFLCDLAKFQIYYMAKDATEGMKRTYTQQIENMAKAVNAVNKMCADKLEELYGILYRYQMGYNCYRPNGWVYGARMATLTYSLDDKQDGESRQALWLDYVNDTGKHGNKQVAYCYQPNKQIVDWVANDFKEFAGDYCTSAYTIQDYLTNAGFWARNGELFDKAAGLFLGDMYVDKYGFMHDDKDYSFRYYDRWGNARRSNAYTVATWHTWYGGIDHTAIRGNDKNYYLCFTRSNDAGTWHYLDGAYQETYMWDPLFTVNEAVYYHPHYNQFLNNKPGPITLKTSW